MPQPLRITLLVFASLGIVGLITYAFFRTFRKSEDPIRLAVKWIVTLVIIAGLFWNTHRLTKAGAGSFVDGAVTAALIIFPCLAAAILFSVMWTSSLGQFLFGPLLAAFDGGNEELEPAPLYSIAESLRRRGKFREAIHTIQEQLQKFPRDFTGQMMVAEIHAENLNDLQAAEVTIHRLCEQKDHSPASLVFALNSLADWQLKYAQDVDAATVAMDKIISLLPDSEFARAASNRIAHFSSREQLIHAREPETIRMKHGVEYLGLLKDQSHLMPKEKAFKDEAAELVAHLDSHPLDNEARERLAIIYARDYQRLDLATEQLEQFIALPGESPKHVARWLNLLADLQVHCTNNTQLAEQTLQRIIELFPNQSQAELAQQRIAVLALELKHYEKSRVVKFGSGSNT